MYSDTRLEYEYINEEGVQLYSLMEKLVLSHDKYDIVLPRGTMTRYTTYPEVIYYYLLTQRTITPIYASSVYWYAMKCSNIKFTKRLWRFIKSLRNLF